MRWFQKSSFTQSQGKAAHDVIALSLVEVVEERIISESDRLDVIDVSPPRTCLAFMCTSRNCTLTGNFNSNEVIHELISFGNFEPLRVFHNSFVDEEGCMFPCRLVSDFGFDIVRFVVVFSLKFVFFNHPADVVLSVMDSAQTPAFRRLANRSTQGVTMDAMNLRKLFDALNSKSSGILNLQA